MSLFLHQHVPGGRLHQYRLENSGVKLDVPMNKVVLHTTEGSSLPGYSGGLSAPHATIDMGRRRFYEHFSADQGARALRPGGVRANNAGTYQIEIIGRAKDSQDWPEDDYQYIADVLEVVMAKLRIPVKSGLTFYDVNGGYGYGAESRLTAKGFASFRGIMAHQHVPGNTHWDTGELDIDLLLGLMTGEPIPDKPKPTDPTPGSKYDLLKTDGVIGRKSVLRAQEFFGTTQDGVISSQSWIWEDDWEALTTAQWLSPDKAVGSRLAIAIQEWCGADPDGILGGESAEKFQAKLKRLGYYKFAVDGEIERGKASARGFQEFLNDQAKKG